MLSEDQGEDGAGCVAAGEGESAVTFLFCCKERNEDLFTTFFADRRSVIAYIDDYLLYDFLSFVVEYVAESVSWLVLFMKFNAVKKSYSFVKHVRL